MRFKIGKVPPASLLRAVYPHVGTTSRSLLIGPGIGRDVAAVRYGRLVQVFSTDPVTGTATHIGRHSVIINANDIAVAGARPRWYVCTILLPRGTTENALRKIMADMDQAAKELGVSIIGGHTEVTPGLTRPIIAGFMVGQTTTNTLLDTGGGREGDRILFTKTAGLEGTAILATDYPAKLADVGRRVLERARKFSEQISVVKEAIAVAGTKVVHAMHDPTEGGVLNGLWELAEASKLGILADVARMPVAEETRMVCEALGLDPLKLMSSGSLLIAIEPSKTRDVKEVLGTLRVKVSEVGRLLPKSKGKHVIRGRTVSRLEAVPTDELYKLS